jgi:hypothetical protein
MVGEESDALAYARDIVDRSGPTRYLLDAFSLPVWLLRRAGELDRIAGLLDELRRFDMPRPRTLFGVVEALELEADDPAAALQLLDSAVIDLLDLGLIIEAVLALSDEVRIARSIGDDARAESRRDRARGLLEPERAGPLLERLGL